MPEGLESWLRWGALFVLAYLGALWIGLAIWAYRDMASRTKNPFLRAVVPLFVTVFSFLGVPVYLLLRPPLTLAEQYERTLEEEALLREVENQRACPTCKGVVEEDHLFCPNCGTRLRDLCANCERPLQPRWVICPYCGFRPEPVEVPVPQTQRRAR